jgi:hypothetical protein
MRRSTPILVSALLFGFAAPALAATGYAGGKLSSSATAGGLLLPNGSFEAGLTGWAGYGATLSLVGQAADGVSAARVSLSGTGTSFSILPSPRPVSTTVAGAVYTAGAAVRSQIAGRQLCLRMREYAAGSVVGSAMRCVSSTTSWQQVTGLSYTAKATGNQLDVYVFELQSVAGDSFDVDAVTLTSGAAPSSSAPVNTAPPAVSGQALVGATLIGSVGSWQSSEPVQYGLQWRRCDAAGSNCGAIAGATASTYTLGAADEAKTVRLQVTATNDSGGSSSANSAPTASVAAAPAPAPPPAPPASGLSATTMDHAHIRLDWAAVSSASTYRVLRGTLVVGQTSGRTFTDTLLWPQTRYDYRVEALAGDGTLVQGLSAAGTTGLLPAGGFPRAFAASSVWNQPVGSTPLHPNSGGHSAYLLANAKNPNLALNNYAVSVAEAHPEDATYSVPCTRYSSCTINAFGAFAIPRTAQPDPSGDGHLAVYDPRTQREWDFWRGTFSGSAWSTGAGAAVSTLGDGTAPGGTVGANAANFPLLGGLIRPEELLQGRIDHALVFMMPGVSTLGHVCPATRHAGTVADPNALQEGMRIQLDPAVDVDALPLNAWQKTIARALQRYGAYLRDGSGSLAILAENPRSRGYDAWAKVGLSGSSVSLAALPWSRMRVLQPPATGC